MLDSGLEFGLLACLPRGPSFCSRAHSAQRLVRVVFPGINGSLHFEVGHPFLEAGLLERIYSGFRVPLRGLQGFRGLELGGLGAL